MVQLSQMVNLLVNSNSGETAANSPDDLTLPMETIEDLRTNEEKLENKENLKALVFQI